MICPRSRPRPGTLKVRKEQLGGWTENVLRRGNGTGKALGDQNGVKSIRGREGGG